jgi:hypothetical protein
MSYTTIERVKSYLTSNYAVAERVVDLPITLLDTTPLKFWGCAIEAGSLRVKSQQTLSPVRQTITVSVNGMTVTNSPIVRGSVVLATDSSLGRIYIENLDYIVQYESSTLQPKSGGALVIGQNVVVWYIPMHLYAAGEDYAIDHDRAEIRRLVGGGIESGETIDLDFVPVFTGFDEQLIAVAVNEANSAIEREIDPERQFGADESLVAAATCKALEIVCFSAASRELSNGRGLDKIALTWLILAESYHQRGANLLSSFRPTATGPSAPVHS